MAEREDGQTETSVERYSRLTVDNERLERSCVLLNETLTKMQAHRDDLDAECKRLREALDTTMRRAYAAEGAQDLAIARADEAEADNERLRYALRTIVGPSDTGPLMDAYRKAGGGYEGLQAIARVALGEESANG